MKKKLLIPLIIFSIVVIAVAGGAIVLLLNEGSGDDTAENENQSENNLQSSGVVKIPDTAQSHCFDEGESIDCPTEGVDFYGQDAQYVTNEESYRDNGDGTITDNVTGLMWQQDPGEKQTYSEAIAAVEDFSLAGYDDWRVPTIKELYSLMSFEGQDPSNVQGNDTSGLIPFINDDIFAFYYGDTDVGDRIIDSQWVTGSIYESKVMNNQSCFFGVNFADGRIKCYPNEGEKTYYAIYVRSGNGKYGQNDFIDNGDETVTDQMTGLTWMQNDSTTSMNWKDGLGFCEDLSLGGNTDWRLPNAKELEYIVDYSRTPDTTNSPALDPIFNSTMIENEDGEDDWGFYWTSTTHINNGGYGTHAAYISFGRALGYMNGSWMDVHGAGAQRSDPKVDSTGDYPTGHGSQGDAVRGLNFVRCVRGGTVADSAGDSPLNSTTSESQINSPTSQSSSQAEPPEAAINACANLKSGDTCRFTAPNGNIPGKCQSVLGQLACVP